jgi:cysteine synthase
MSMYDFLLILQGCVFGFVMGQIYFAYKVRKTIDKMSEAFGLDLNKLNQDILDEKAQVKITKAENYFTETLENSILLYSKSTGNFIAQAETMSQLADDLYKFNKVRFAIVKHDKEEFVFIEGKVVPNLQVIE